MITLTHALGSITLDNPILGDSEQLDIKVKYEFSMARVVHSTKKTTPHSKLILAFDKITRTKMLEFNTFLLNARGIACTYVDYNGDSWIGTILGDPFEFQYLGTKVCEDTDPPTIVEIYSITIEFEDIDS